MHLFCAVSLPYVSSYYVTCLVICRCCQWLHGMNLMLKFASIVLMPVYCGLLT